MSGLEVSDSLHTSACWHILSFTRKGGDPLASSVSNGPSGSSICGISRPHKFPWNLVIFGSFRRGLCSNEAIVIVIY